MSNKDITCSASMISNCNNCTQTSLTRASGGMTDDQFRSVVAHTPLIIYSLDQYGVFTLSEGLGLQKLGLFPGEAVGQSALELYQDYPDIVQAVKRALAGEAVFFTHCVGDVCFDNRMVPLVDMHGRVTEVVGAALDISELKKNEAQLMEKDQSLQANYDELTAMHQELAATAEELRVQYDEILRINQQVVKQNSILSMLEETTFSLINKLEMEQLLHTIVARAADMVGAVDAFISLPSADGLFLEVKAGIGIYSDAIRFLPRGWGLMGKVFASGQAEVIADYRNWEGRPQAPFVATIHTLFAAPLWAKQKTAGVFGVAFCQPGRRFDEDQVKLLERFSELASIALENAALHANLQQELHARINSETTLNEIFNGANDAILVNDPETGAILWANQRASEIFGYSEEELRQLGAVSIATPQNLEAAIAAMRKAVSEGAQLYERETKDKFGQRITVEVNAKKALIRGRPLCLTIMRDITQRKLMEKVLLKTELEKQAVLDAIPDIILIFDQDGYLLEYKTTPDFETALALEPDVIGRNISAVNIPADIARNYAYYIRLALDSGRTQFYEYHLPVRGSKRYREVRFNKVSSSSVLALLRDITEMRRSQEQVEFLSMHDLMTGVYNRTYFEEEICRAARRSDRGAAVLVCDVDGLKLINDTLGHSAGDSILRVVASALRSTVITGDDVVARIGGDEFAIITYNPDKLLLEAAIEKFADFIAAYNQNNPHLPVSVSVGWAADYLSCQNIDDLLKQADNDMYRQKMHQSQSMRSAIVQTMMKALEARDYITEGHADRLQELVEGLGQKLKLSGSKLADLRLFAQFHDIGKVGIPDHILNKPGKLDDEEFAVMRRHSEIGYRIALASPDLAPIADLVLKHHEWWNGKGYPLGIEGREIPLECRILALADAYDAMTNDRPYRKALQPDAAVSELRRCAGQQFDPELVEMFISLLRA